MTDEFLELYPRSKNPHGLRIFRADQLDLEDIQDYNVFLSKNCEFAGLNIMDLNYYVADIIDSEFDRKCMCTFKIVPGKRQNKTIIELWDVCTSQTNRKKGYAQTLIKGIRKIYKKKFTNLVIWLGVEVKNIPAQNLYIKLGFCNPRFTSTTPSGIVFQGKTFIGLIYKDQCKNQQEKTQKMINAMIEIERQRTPKLYEFFINSEDIKLMKTQLTDKKEWGCCWSIAPGTDELRIIPDSWTHSKDEYDFDPKDIQNVLNSFSVMYKNLSTFKSHTHPWVAYDVYNTAIGYPSTPDYMYLIFGDEYAHMVFSIEGIYLLKIPIQSRLSLKYLIEFNPECAKIFQELIPVYINIEKGRTIENVFEQTTNPFTAKEYRNKIKKYTQPDPNVLHMEVVKHIQHIESLTFQQLTTFKPTQYHDLAAHNLTETEFIKKQQALKNCLKTFTDLDRQIVYVTHVNWLDIENAFLSNLRLKFNIEILKTKEDEEAEEAQKMDVDNTV